MKDSGVPWIGEIPAGWEVKPYKYIVSIPVTDGPHETPELHENGIPFISAEAICNNKIDFNKKRGYISEEDHKRYCKKYSPQLDDIYLIKSGATTGNLSIVETTDVFNIWSPLAVIRINKNNAIPQYILRFMQSSSFQTSIQLYWNFGTQQNIGMSVIENLSVALPPLPEQRAIAAFLDRETSRIDAIIDKVTEQITTLRELRQTLISHAVTGRLTCAARLRCRK
jgi:type I restriction enzyme S subunit